MSSSQTQERNKRAQDATWKAIWPQGLTADSAKELSDIASDSAPEVQEDLRNILQALVRTTGTVRFATDWKDSEDAMTENLNDAVRDAVISYFKGDRTPLFVQRCLVGNLVSEFFFNEDRSARLSRPQVESHLPLIEAIARIYMRERHESKERGEGAGRRHFSRNIATFLGSCPSESLPFFASWRDELIEEVNAGNCDDDLPGTTNVLYSPDDTITVAGLPVGIKPEVKHFLGPLIEAIDARKEGE